MHFFTEYLSGYLCDTELVKKCVAPTWINTWYFTKMYYFYCLQFNFYVTYIHRILKVNPNLK